MSFSPEIRDHQRWLGYLQPEGLVVSPAALVDSGAVFNRSDRPLQQRFLEHLRLHQSWDGASDPFIHSLPDFLTDFLDWETSDYISNEAIPESLTTYIPAYRETLRPTHAVMDPEEAEKCLLLILETSSSDFDQPGDENSDGWHVSPSLRLERILQDTGVGIGLLSNGTHFRLISAPSGENAGSLTFPISSMVEIPGRPVLSGFHLLLDGYRLFQASENDSLPGILKKSRDYQANVSTDLAAQVLDGLYELLRGLQAAHAKSDQKLLAETLAKNPDAIYEAQLNVLMRLVFLLFAEDRNLMPGSSLYLQNYGVHALYDQLRKDREHFPDTMDLRYGAWSRLLSLFRLVHSGSRHHDVSMPARSGYLFDPTRFPFLEARNTDGELADHGLPKIPDATICSVLEKLLYLKGEKLSYRTLDVEQIGSVYETMMGFRLLVATGPTIALNPKKKGGAPTNINLDEVLATPEKDLKKWFKAETDRELTATQLKALKAAESHNDILAALERIIAKNATPQIAHAGSLLLQPSDARRKSGSHYTPRKLTKPIVEKALEPLFAQLGDNPAPEQILDLKVCDPAVGSGAFLVEACRQLGDKLVTAWESHQLRPRIPSDETDILHARRLIAQRCLYGVDRNRMASDLAKLSLWLATLAKDHPFTFLDHSIRWGDSLVGLSVDQIRAFHWDTSHKTAQNPQLGEEKLGKRIKEALKHRQRILTGDDFLSPELKTVQLAAADKELDKVRLAGDLTILSFFSSSNKVERQDNRDETLGRWLISETTDKATTPEELRKALEEGLALKAECYAAREIEKPIHPFHWQIEFPEVFGDAKSGFDTFVGNPPYAGKNNVIAGNAEQYSKWLQQVHSGAHGNADLAAHFFRRAYAHNRVGGTVGFVTTNTIAQGDTRETGLTWILREQKGQASGSIYQATRRYKWVGAAAVVVSIVHLQKGSFSTEKKLNGKTVDRISSYLVKGYRDESPKKLHSNSRLSFAGVYILGMGFTFDDTDSSEVASPISEMLRLVDKNQRNKEVILPFIGGSEVNSSPSHRHHRYVINFGEMDLEEVKQTWPDLLSIVEAKVKPARLKQKREIRKRYWWRFGEPSPSLFRSIASLTRILVQCRISPHLGFVFLEPGSVFDISLNVFCLDQMGSYTILQSRLHETWARFFGSSMKDDLRYTPSDCFETFPFPSDWETDSSLEKAGHTYYEFRAALMIENDQGLTATFNRFNKRDEQDPKILKLRELHTAMDRAVLDAYGWTDISTECEFIPDFTEEDDDGNIIEKNIRYRWPDEVRDEVLARLLVLNAERYQEELAAGLHTKAKKKTAKKTARKKIAKKATKKEAKTINLIQDGEMAFVSTLNLPTWASNVPKFSYNLNSARRTAAVNGLAYYRALIPALVQEAGGQLPVEVVYNAVSRLENITDTLGLNKNLPDNTARKWQRTFKEPIGAEAFGSTLESLCETRGDVRLVGSRDSLELLQAIPYLHDVSCHHKQR